MNRPSTAYYQVSLGGAVWGEHEPFAYLFQSSDALEHQNLERMSQTTNQVKMELQSTL